MAFSNFFFSRFRLNHASLMDSEKDKTMSPSKRDYQRRMTENLNGGDLDKTRIISYANKAPQAPESHSNGLKVLYSSSKNSAAQSAKKKSTRHIPQVILKIKKSARKSESEKKLQFPTMLFVFRCPTESLTLLRLRTTITST